MRLALLAPLLICTSAPLWAEGFQQSQLDRISVDTSLFTGGSFASDAAPERLTVFCTDCDGTVAIDIQTGRSTDGTEGRYRSGETTIDALREICVSRAPECTLEAAEVGGAVGWVTGYNIGDGSGATAVLFQDGDLLTIRSIAGDPETAHDNMDAALESIAPQIAGARK